MEVVAGTTAVEFRKGGNPAVVTCGGTTRLVRFTGIVAVPFVGQATTALVLFHDPDEAVMCGSSVVFVGRGGGWVKHVDVKLCETQTKVG